MEKELEGILRAFGGDESNDSEKLPNNTILACTGKPYDGVDKQFEDLLLETSTDYESSVFIQHQGLRKTLELKCGEPLFHIAWLIQYTFKILRSHHIEQVGLEYFLTYILRWMQAQCDKLISDAKSDEELSEYQLSQKIFKNGSHKDDCAFTMATESLSKIMCVLIELTPDNRLLEIYINTLMNLEKCLSFAFNKDPILSKKKHKNSFITVLSVVKFDCLFTKLHFLAHTKQFANAEAYANKCLKNLQKIHNDHKPWLIYKIAIVNAYIASQTNDVDMCLKNIAIILNTDSKNKKKFREEKHAYFTSACEFAGSYFEKTDEIDKAIKYYNEALNFSDTTAEIHRYTEKLKTISGPLVKQLAGFAHADDFKNILKDVKCYPSKSRFDLYFLSDKYIDRFRSLLAKADMKTTLIPNITNALAVEINYECNADIFKAALIRIKSLQQKDLKQEQLLLAKTKVKEIPDHTSSKIPHLEGMSGSHPKAVVTKRKIKKTDNPQHQPIEVPKWAFLEQMRPKPLVLVEFPTVKKVFNPENRNGVIALQVNGVSGRWFACMNPRIIQEIESIQKSEGLKINKRFECAIEVGNDFCVPCYKEMKTKSAELGINLPYVFKIRLLGEGGIGNVRIYAKVIDQTPDGKKLVAFTAINPNSHVKHSRPLEFEMPEVVEEKLLFSNSNNGGK